MAGASAAAAANASAGPSASVFDVNRAVGAAGQRFADHLLHARRAGRADHHFAAVLLAQAQRLFERVGVGLVHLVADVLLANPRLVVVQARLPLARGHLLDANGNFHDRQPLSNLLNNSAPLVPPKPNEFDSA